MTPTDKFTQAAEWGTHYVSKSGMALQNFLNESNFQPGKFLVLDSEHPDMVHQHMRHEALPSGIGFGGQFAPMPPAEKGLEDGE